MTTSKEELLRLSDEVKNEKTRGGNTAIRIGGLFRSIIEWVNLQLAGKASSGAILATNLELGKKLSKSDCTGSSGGGYLGTGATCSSGAAIGNGAISTSGGAVGYGAWAGGGFSAGKNARADKVSGNFIDCIQLGGPDDASPNKTPKSLRVYQYTLMDPDGSIPKARMPYVITRYPNAGILIGTKTSSENNTGIAIGDNAKTTVSNGVAIGFNAVCDIAKSSNVNGVTTLSVSGEQDYLLVLPDVYRQNGCIVNIRGAGLIGGDAAVIFAHVLISPPNGDVIVALSGGLNISGGLGELDISVDLEMVTFGYVIEIVKLT